MIRSNLLKVAMVFAAGVVLTLASLIYSRTQELNQLRAAAHKGAAVQPPGGSEAEASARSENSPISDDAGEAQSVTMPQPVQMTHKNGAPVQAEVPGPAVRSRSTKDIGESSPMAEVRQSSLPNDTQGSSVAPNVPASIPAAPQAEASKVQQPNSSEAIPRSPNVVTLQAGTGLSIRLAQSVSTDRNRSGDLFRGELDAPLIVNGIVVAENGSVALGRLVKVKRARLGKSDLRMELTGITTSDGQRIRVETGAWEEKSARRSIEDTPRMAAGAAIGAVRGALGGAARGAGLVSEDEGGTGTGHAFTANKRTVTLPAGSRVTFRLAIPVTITERLNYR